MQDLPFWQARRASVYAELGELREATTPLADESLTSIREALDPFASDYRLLSQEAWVMMLARTLSRNSWASDRKEMKRATVIGGSGFQPNTVQSMA